VHQAGVIGWLKRYAGLISCKNLQKHCKFLQTFASFCNIFTYVRAS